MSAAPPALTLQDSFVEFLRLVGGDGAPPELITTMRVSFICGAETVFRSFAHCNPGKPSPELIALMRRLAAELKANHDALVKRGQAGAA